VPNDHNPKTESAESVLLDALRWREDMQVTNHEGEGVWLRPSLNASDERTGVTDCCFAEAPCDRHRHVPLRNGWGACRHGNGFPCPICCGVPARQRGGQPWGCVVISPEGRT
jgi:hypothetical protein